MTAIDNGKVLIKNTLTGLYGEVPRFIFEHPVYGQYMVPDDREDQDCIDCGKNAEVLDTEVIDNKAPAATTKAKDK